jgi:hypothetical protein
LPALTLARALEQSMKKVILAAVMLALGACESAHTLSEGERLNWTCAGGKAFSLRYVSGDLEVFAAGQTHRLQRAPGEDAVHYSNGEVEYIERDRSASLTGIYGGPYENCRQPGVWRRLL